jgi:hypothetical protein
MKGHGKHDYVVLPSGWAMDKDTGQLRELTEEESSVYNKWLFEQMAEGLELAREVPGLNVYMRKPNAE